MVLVHLPFFFPIYRIYLRNQIWTLGKEISGLELEYLLVPDSNKHVEQS